MKYGNSCCIGWWVRDASASSHEDMHKPCYTCHTCMLQTFLNLRVLGSEVTVLQEMFGTILELVNTCRYTVLPQIEAADA